MGNNLAINWVKRYPLTSAALCLLLLSYIAFFGFLGIGTILSLMGILLAIGLSIAGILKEPSKYPALLVHMVSMISLMAGALFIISLFSNWNSGSDSLDMM